MMKRIIVIIFCVLIFIDLVPIDSPAKNYVMNESGG